jgi:hypothetical protein
MITLTNWHTEQSIFYVCTPNEPFQVKSDAPGLNMNLRSKLR